MYCLSFLDLRLLITPLVSCGHCIFVLPRFTISNYPFGILWPLYCLSFLHLQLLITPLVTCSHCIICPSSIYDFWLPLWYLVAIVFSVILRFCIVCHSSIYDFWLLFWYLVAIVLSFPPRFTTSDYPFGILWPLYFLSFLDLRLLISPLVSCDHCIVCHSSILYCLSFLDLRLLITPLVSFGHCVVCTSSIYDLWLPFWYLVAIVLSFPPRFTTSDYPFGILWPLYFLSFLDLRLLISPLVSCDHCIVCLSFLDFDFLLPLLSFGHCVVCTSSIYDLWLSFWYLVAIVLSVRPRITTLYCLSLYCLPRFTTSGYPFDIIVCPSSIYDFWLPFWYPVAIVLSVLPRFTTSDWNLVAIVLSVLPRFTTSDYPFGILWPLHCLSFLDLRLLITPLVSCGHCIVCRSWIYDLWLPIWYLVAIVLSVLLRFTTSDYPFGILWPLYCLSFLDLRLLITPLVSCGHCIFVLPRFTISNYPFGILWPLYCLSFLHLQLLITPLVTCSHCIICPSSIYDFWLPLWYLVAIVFSVILRFCIVCHSSIYDFWLLFWYLVAIVLSFPPRFTTSDYPFGILWPLYFLSFLDLRLLISPLVSCDHCVVCTSSIYDLWLSFWYLVAIVLSVRPRITTYDYPFGILWPLYCLSFFDLRLLVTPLISCGHCIVCPSSIYDFWLPFWYPVAIVLSVLPRFTSSDYPFGIFWPLFCLSFPDLRLLITPLVSCGHCIVCPSSIYDFWLPFWYLLAIVLSVLPRFTTSDYPFGILWPLYCLSFLDLRLLITPLVSCGHCIFVLPRFTIFNYPFGILWPLYCLSFLDLRLLITPLVSCGHCIVCPSSILYYLSFLDLRLLITPLVSCGHCIFCHSSILYCLSFLDLRLLITLLVSCGHCIVFPSSFYDFWLPFWYIVAIVFSVLPRFTASDFPFGILWPLYCLSFLDFVLSVIPRFTTSYYPFGIFWPLCCMYFLDIRLLITPLVSCGRYIVCPSSIYDFWLPLWYLVAIVFSSFLDLRFLITPLVSCGHCIVCPSSIYNFWLPLW